MTRDGCQGYLDRKRMLCTDLAQCVNEHSGYAYQSRGRNYCVTEQECRSKQNHYVDHASNSCVEYSVCEEYMLDDATCVTREECATVGYTYESSGIKLCLTDKECAQRGYEADRLTKQCVSVGECAGYKLLNGTCVSEKTCRSR